MIPVERFDSNGLRVLGREECLQRLRRSTIGRVGVSSAALPLILPVGFVVHADRIVLRTSPGTRLEAALDDAVVCFEADEFDVAARSGWSVVLTGRSEVLARDDERYHLASMVLPEWGSGDGGSVVAISPAIMTGRELSSASPPRARPTT